jgi:hypothetical protein
MKKNVVIKINEGELNEFFNKNLQCAKNLVQFLGKEVYAPSSSHTPMILVEIYSNGNVGCIPINCTDYDKELKEFHACSIKTTIF